MKTHKNPVARKRCAVTGKSVMYGNNVSHSHKKTRRRFEANLHFKRFYLPEEKRWVKLRVSAKGLKVIAKRGISKVMADIRKRERAL